MLTDIKFRNVESGDIDNLFKWRNHPVIRSKSFNTDPIPWIEHEKWFETKSNDPDTTIYMACCGGDKIGSIRFEKRWDAIRVSVMLNPAFLGKGLGSKLIRLGTERFINDRKPDKPIIAEIKKDNTASVKAFQKAGFKESHITFIYNV